MTWSGSVVSRDIGSDAFKDRCSQKHRHNSVCLTMLQELLCTSQLHRDTGKEKQELRKARRVFTFYWTHCQMPAVYQLQSNLQRIGQTSLKLDYIAPRPLPQHHPQEETGNIETCTAGLYHSWSIWMLASSISPDEHLVIPRVHMHTQLEIRPTCAKSLSCYWSCASPTARSAPNLSNHAENWEARGLPSHPPQS